MLDVAANLNRLIGRFYSRGRIIPLALDEVLQTFVVRLVIRLYYN